MTPDTLPVSPGLSASQKAQAWTLPAYRGIRRAAYEAWPSLANPYQAGTMEHEAWQAGRYHAHQENK